MNDPPGGRRRRPRPSPDAGRHQRRAVLDAEERADQVEVDGGPHRLDVGADDRAHVEGAAGVGEEDVEVAPGATRPRPRPRPPAPPRSRRPRRSGRSRRPPAGRGLGGHRLQRRRRRRPASPRCGRRWSRGRRRAPAGWRCPARCRCRHRSRVRCSRRCPVGPAVGCRSRACPPRSSGGVGRSVRRSAGPAAGVATVPGFRSSMLRTADERQSGTGAGPPARPRPATRGRTRGERPAIQPGRPVRDRGRHRARTAWPWWPGDVRLTYADSTPGPTGSPTTSPASGSATGAHVGSWPATGPSGSRR